MVTVAGKQVSQAYTLPGLKQVHGKKSKEENAASTGRRTGALKTREEKIISKPRGKSYWLSGPSPPI